MFSIHEDQILMEDLHLPPYLFIYFFFWGGGAIHSFFLCVCVSFKSHGLTVNLEYCGFRLTLQVIINYQPTDVSQPLKKKRKKKKKKKKKYIHFVTEILPKFPLSIVCFFFSFNLARMNHHFVALFLLKHRYLINFSIRKM